MKIVRKGSPKIGLALGAGGPKGLAHIGVIKVLENNNIPIDFIAGSSIGALVGGLYAATKDISKIEKLALGVNWRELFYLLGGPSLDFSGFIKGEKIEEFISKQFKIKNFDNLKIPFVAVSTDIITGKEVDFKKGNLLRAIRASISLPLIFTPLRWQNKVLVDGGISTPMPTTLVRKMGADIVIGVNVLQNHISLSKRRSLKLFSVAEVSLEILQANLARSFLKKADIAIEPVTGKVSWINLLDFLKAKKLIKQGVQAANLAVPKIKELLSS